MATPLSSLKFVHHSYMALASTALGKVCIFVTDPRFWSRTYIHRKCKLDVYHL